MIEISKRFFGKAQTLAWINYVLNVLLFLATVTIIFTGLMISETFMLLGITVAKNGMWHGVHTAAAKPFISWPRCT